MPGSATLLALLCAGCIAAPLPARAATAEGHPLHVRARTVARQTELAPSDRSKSSSHAKPDAAKPGRAKSAAKESGKTAGSKGAAGSAKTGRGAAKTPSDKGGSHSRAGRHHHPLEDESEPVTIHRAGWHEAQTSPRGRTLAMQAAPARRPKAAPLKRNDAPFTAVADAAKPLTVEDFMRAASPAEATPAPDGKVYVPGESRTEEDDRVDNQHVLVATPRPLPRPVLALKPVPVKRPAMMASVEAAGTTTAPIERDAIDEDAPSDLVGAPLPSANVDTERMAASGPVVRTGSLPSRLPMPTRQELVEEVEQPVVLPGLYRNGRLVVPAPLKGTHEILVHQNLMADDEGLERIQDDYDLNRLRTAHLLVNFPESASLHMNPELAANRRCARVWTVKFASDMARDFYARFHQPLQVNSAVRTVAYQVRLQRTNGNAAGIGGETASPHLTGQALDFGKRDMSMAQIAWMRSYLLPLMQAGKLDVEEEFQQACFHISVYRSYLPAQKRRIGRTEVAQLKEPRVKAPSRGEDLR